MWLSACFFFVPWPGSFWTFRHVNVRCWLTDWLTSSNTCTKGPVFGPLTFSPLLFNQYTAEISNKLSLIVTVMTAWSTWAVSLIMSTLSLQSISQSSKQTMQNWKSTVLGQWKQHLPIIRIVHGSSQWWLLAQRRWEWQLTSHVAMMLR